MRDQVEQTEAQLASAAPDHARPATVPLMAREAHQLASRFRRALLYVVEQLGEVGTTKLQKILYLADLEHYLAAGTTLTGARWVRYTYGPMAKALVPATIDMEGHEIEVSVEPAGPYASRVYRPGPSPRFRPGLAPEERQVLDQVIDLTRDLTAKQAISLAYNTAPMRVLLRLEIGREPLLDVEIPFDIDDELVSESSAPEAVHDPEAIARHKRSELARVADLIDAAIS